MKNLKLSITLFSILISFNLHSATIDEVMEKNEHEGLISNKVEIMIDDNNIYHIWDIFMDVKTPQKIFKKVGLVAGVVYVNVIEGPWNHVGAKRNVELDDFSTAKEMITQIGPHEFFEYKITEITNTVGKQALYAQGQWWFESTSDGKTRVTWIYSFKPKGVFSKGILSFVLCQFFDPYMQSTIKNLKNLVERKY